MEEANYPAVALVACGSAGIAMCSGIAKNRYGINKIIAIDTSERALKACRNADQTIWIGNQMHEKPGSPAQLREVAGEFRSAIKQALSGMQVVIIVAGAAGVAGGTLAPLVAEYANRDESVVLALVSWPFAFEERQGHRQALITVGELLAHANSVLPLHEPAPDADKSVTTVIAERQTALRHYLWHVCGCLFRPKLADIDFEEIRSVFTLKRGCHVSHLGWGEASGATRAALAVAQAMSHPGLLPLDRITPRSLSVDIRASRTSLAMKEVAEVMDQILHRLAEEPLTVVFSAGHDEDLGDRLQVSLIVN